VPGTRFPFEELTSGFTIKSKLGFGGAYCPIKPVAAKARIRTKVPVFMQVIAFSLRQI
jgi:hypothetical protein